MKALITGITGQDGRYLADLLVAKGYEVIGLARTIPDEPLPAVVALRTGDARSLAIVRDLLREERPDEIYHLAAETSVERSWDNPESARESAQGGLPGLLEAAREWVANARIFVATSSEVFSGTTESPQHERTALAPASPYGQGKAEALTTTRAFRAEFGMHVSAGILYNHESPRRPPRFVTRKVTRAAAAIAAGRQQELRMGNLDARRDWGFAGDYVDAMWRMLQTPTPDDYVIGTGVGRTVAELCEVAFERVGLDYRHFVTVDPAFFRPVDSTVMLANPSRARERLQWEPLTPFRDMIHAMVDADVERLKRGET